MIFFVLLPKFLCCGINGVQIFESWYGNFGRLCGIQTFAAVLICNRSDGVFCVEINFILFSAGSSRATFEKEISILLAGVLRCCSATWRKWLRKEELGGGGGGGQLSL